MITQDLIKKFFRQECTPEERDIVLKYFETHPDAFDNYWDEREWEHLDGLEAGNIRLSQKMFSKVSRRTTRKKKVLLLRNAGIAASVLLMLLVAGSILYKTRNHGDVISGYKSSVSTSDSWIQRENTGSAPLNVLLEDGSLVVVEPGGCISYHQPFNFNGERVIYVEGEARFNVAKDKKRPFRVFSDALVTTALGTSFTVKAIAGKEEITVALHEGRVVVKPSRQLKAGWEKDFFLFPGDQLFYNKTRETARLQVGQKVPHPATTTVAGKPDAAPEVLKPDWYKFDGMPLKKVIEQLKVYYGVDIRYASPDMEDKYFTIRIDKHDSIENVLNDIALLNDFILTKKNGVYFLLKK
jgi:ferric-dicitrate binding protein FerR (iron transport regulator)